MKSRNTVFLFLLLVFLAAYFIFKWRGLQQNDWQTQIRNQEFDRRTSTLQYTHHALCRMDCRHISKTDVQDIMLRGEINYAKSDAADKPCPTYALQGYTTDGQHLRVIFAQCSQETKVITCYDLEQDFECHCPGDEKKNH
jgi:hypothetical protein